MPVFDPSWVFAGYVLAYGGAATLCGVALRRALRVEDPETRRGLVGLLVGSGGWAAWELAYLFAPTPGTKYASYLLSLVVGFTTVGAWLYFCSAYTSRSFHRNPSYRRAAVGLYLAIVAVKVTNPLHGRYFTTQLVTEPFTHLAIVHGTFHWVVSGLSYALVAVGFFMLYELFLEADYDTRPLGVVAAVTGLPVAFDVVGAASTVLVDINYEPLGVAVFAVGVLYLFEEEFLAVQLTDGVDDAVVYLDDDGRVRQANGRARELFPALAGATGAPFEDALPAAAACLDGDDPVLERRRDGETRYHLVSDTSFTLGQTDLGRLVVFSDVTETERQRRELERQNQQLEGFAAAIRHELLNMLQIVSGRVAVAGEALDRGDVGEARESLRRASEASDRMSGVVDDLAALARYGQTLEETARVDLGSVVESAWRAAETDGLTLSATADARIDGHPDRVHGLFESAFAFAAHHGASTVEVTLVDGGFAVADDGNPVADADPEDYFAYGVSVPDAEAGLLLPNVRMLARTHGWEATLDAAYTDGVRVVVSGVDVRSGNRQPA